MNYSVDRLQEGTIYIADIIEDLALLEEQVQLCSYEKQIYSDIHNHKRRREWLSVRYWLQELCNDVIQIRYEKSGKPFILDRSYNISISHSFHKLAIILSKEKQVAIDIEKCSNRASKVSERFIRDDEKIEADNSDEFCTLIWASKEALFKFSDDEKIDFKENLKLKHINPLKQEGALEGHIKLKKETIVEISYSFRDGYIISWICD